MRSFDVFVLPSLSEAQPVTILEAMACALPVVASAVGGVPQLVLEGQTGLLVDSMNPVTLAQAIAVYVRDPALGRRHGAAGQAHVRIHHDVDVMVCRYAMLYERHLAAASVPIMAKAAFIETSALDDIVTCIVRKIPGMSERYRVVRIADRHLHPTSPSWRGPFN